ncbi:polysaccharide deacetylase family protein [Tepidibacillus sp. HK-1]|nr:polysaccharide deacetylase family protein [Tepidibacillus sp. HK-1]GBF11289.1 peptidoglycan-N-acetylglucosamine deacetylase [Tepidibacillus sp. HK-1]
MKWVKMTVILLIMFTLFFSIANYKLINSYISVIKKPSKESTEKLRKVIHNYAIKNNINPIEPKIDKIWKLIPGYNGLVVDEETTLKLAEKQDLQANDKIPYVWLEIEPKNGIDQLGNHPIYRGNPEKPMVSLMINVAWGTEYLESMLDILNKEQVKATFFLDGSWLKKNPNVAKKIAANGHEIGNHAYSHPQMSRISNERIREEILKTEKLIQQTLNQSSKYFAPPSGDYDLRVVKIAHELKLHTVLWTVDTVDWKKPSPETIINRIVPKVQNGYLILMHPTKSTAEALPTLIREIKKKGLIISPVKETLSSKRVLSVESSPKF